MQAVLFPQYCVLQFSKSPRLGAVKTRLAPALNEVQRSELHSQLTEWVCSQVSESLLSHHQLWVEGDIGHPLFVRLSQQFGAEIFRQQGDDLGEKLRFGLSEGLQRYEGVFLIGSDCPFLSKAYLFEAMKTLQNHDAVIAPASDGGYVLLGLKKKPESVFSEMPWGSDKVFSLTRDRLVGLGCSIAELPTLDDIDRPEDLSLLSSNHLPDQIRNFCDLGDTK